MKTNFKALRARGGILLVLTVAALAASGGAQAGGTTAGTVVNNKATLNFSVGGVGQPVIESSPGGNTSSGVGNGAFTPFTVDNKILHTVATADSAPAVVVAPGQTTVVRNFTVTNNGNLAQGYLLSVANVTSGQSALGVNDSADLLTTSCTTNVTSTGTANIATLNPDLSLAVTVSCSIPATAADNEHIAIALVARATDAGTATPVVETTGAATAGIDVVFADGAGSGVAADANRDGRASGISAYHVSTAVLRVTKAVATQCDPFNGATNPKNIPGAYVRYTITVVNNGSASATLTTMSDALPTASVTFDNDAINPAAVCKSVATGGTATAANRGFSVTARGGAAVTFSSANDADGADNNAGNLSFDFSKLLPLVAGTYTAGELKPTESISVTYQVEIN